MCVNGVLTGVHQADVSLLDYCFFFNDTATTEIYTLSLHDALPIFRPRAAAALVGWPRHPARRRVPSDRKSTRLNSSHPSISYAVFCLKKKKTIHTFFSHSSHRLLLHSSTCVVLQCLSTIYYASPIY